MKPKRLVQVTGATELRRGRRNECLNFQGVVNIGATGVESRAERMLLTV